MSCPWHTDERTNGGGGKWKIEQCSELNQKPQKWEKMWKCMELSYPMIQQRQNKYRLKMSEKSERENEIIYKIESSDGSLKGTIN